MNLNIRMIFLLASLFFATTNLNGQVVVKNLLTDPANYIDGSFERFSLNSGSIGNNSSKRAYIAFTPTEDEILSEVATAISFNAGPGIQNNNPPADPVDIGVAFYSSLTEAEANPERIDFVIETPDLDLENTLGNIEGYDVFKMTLDLLGQNFEVLAGNTYYISLHDQVATADASPLLHNSAAAGDVIGGELDFYFFGVIGGPNPLSTWPQPGEMFASRVTIQSSQPLLGDMNLDSEVNLLDVAPFVELLTNNDFQDEADINQDGIVNLLDVAPFVELLTGG